MTVAIRYLCCIVRALARQLADTAYALGMERAAHFAARAALENEMQDNRALRAKLAALTADGGAA